MPLPTFLFSTFFLVLTARHFLSVHLQSFISSPYRYRATDAPLSVLFLTQEIFTDLQPLRGSPFHFDPRCSHYLSRTTATPERSQRMRRQQHGGNDEIDYKI